jgi:hypothetical protein
VQGRLGPIDPGLEAGLGAPRVRPPILLGIALATIVLVVAGGDTIALVVGGARAADASQVALVRLWRDGALGLLVALGVGACAVGIVESWSSRRAELAALALTVAQARQESRERGRRR